ncbi:polypeptide formylmethionine deformylase [Citrifermentans bemidjiense Bem]|jgi:peptide deformylase|uniref:Peptide deformylase n=1 Tax=Citrifermentans bemidjiense (strain ATCC BAA-1014 / DSM 16622 / JCM 12645 / Bem) TaxID=404380 RepID=B5ED76_CITBB|nr:peptide deformylase [Citrifermentans bemidjiense]ACH37662.1 polypeptide formylmethionine deformylase [Citrifermentans bemidjiense Bem]
MIRTILTYPDPELKKRSLPVTVITDKTRELARDMAETMYDAPGVGLAAPQIGVHQRIIVIDVSGKDETPELIVAINPEIVHAEGEAFEEEGCLSVPKFSANVRRHARIVVKALNLEGEEVTFRADDLLSIAFQHEIDHLDGVLFIDHLSPLKKGIFRKRYQRALDEAKELNR